MQGKPAIIQALNDLLVHEQSSMDLYQVQARMLEDWGYRKLHERLAHESNDEREHATLLIGRILFLDGEPNALQRIPLAIGKSPKEMLENDLKYELDVAKRLNQAMQLCVAEGDNGSRALLEKLLVDTESDHIFWLESQLKLIADVGIERYLAEQF